MADRWEFRKFAEKKNVMIAESLLRYMNEMLRQTPMNFFRYAYELFPWKSQLSGLVGPRGIGKSTMLRQYIIQHRDEGKFLYVSADHTYFSSHSLAALADVFVVEGGTHLVIDEIHKYKGWSRELKQIYDLYPNLRVTFSGSSVLDILKGEADLSRRAVVMTMQGLSFREYLEFDHNIILPCLNLEQILDHTPVAEPDFHPMPYFRDYLSSGYYPFHNIDNFDVRMQQVVSQTTETDIPLFAGMNASTGRKLKQMLSVISTLAPYKPNFENLATELGVSKNNVPEYLTYLEKGGMIGMLRDDTGGMRSLGKVEKVYIDNPTLMTVLSENKPDIGNLRETFFYNQTRVVLPVSSSRESDFRIGSRTFEIGGAGKGKKQLAGTIDGWVVRDNIETGFDRFLPLWEFGLLY